jgi:hypothetical protein
LLFYAMYPEDKIMVSNMKQRVFAWSSS